jgi:hypothetical protein
MMPYAHRCTGYARGGAPSPNALVLESERQIPNGYVSGIASMWLVASGSTADERSNQHYSSNCRGSTAWK